MDLLMNLVVAVPAVLVERERGAEGAWVPKM